MNAVLYTVTCLIWGSTWYAIKLQEGVVPPIWSVAYRFGLAACLLLAICLALKRPLRFTPRQHLVMALQGLTLFCICYALFYYSEKHLVSSVVALIAANISLMNIINSRILLGNRSSLHTIIGSIVGLIGLTMVLWAEIMELATNNTAIQTLVFSVGIALIATYSASLGNIISARSQQQQLPVLQSNFFSMLYGSMFLVIIAFALQQPLRFDTSWTYVSSLLYLAIFGSVIAFQSYLSLLGRIGPARSAYVLVITPMIALLISTHFEGFSWHLYNVLGAILIAGGNILTMKKPAKSQS